MPDFLQLEPEMNQEEVAYRIGDQYFVLQNDQHLVVLVNGVNAVVEGDEAAAQGREHHISVLARPDVVPTKAAEVCL